MLDFHGGASARERVGLERFCPPDALAKIAAEPKQGPPAIAKDDGLVSQIEASLAMVPTSHRLILGDARQLDDIADESVHLVVTSPPYWTLKDYGPGEDQLGHIDDYEGFNDALCSVWAQCLRVLVPGGRMAVNVGDVMLPRRKAGRHLVYPLHATITERCRGIGFDNLTPIIWHKIANVRYESGGGSMLGKPYEPGGIIKSDIEWILLQRKPGGYRKPSLAARSLSVIPQPLHRQWFQPIWSFGGASTRDHPAPYPLELPTRLIRMFSFAGDTVLDPFTGTGTTNMAAKLWGRDSIGVEVQPAYHALAARNISGQG